MNPVDLIPGARVDRYVLLELLGEGGQGAVWKAEDLLHPGVQRALKLVPLALSRPNDVERVRREARALARLTHPSLVASHALFEDLKLGVLGIAMDFVDGASLRWHEDDARLGTRLRALVLKHVAHALAYVHQSGVAHRDLKLDNVLVTKAFWQEPESPENVKLVDFGIAKLDAPVQPLTQLDTIMGTLAYLAPEQLDPAHYGESSPPAADVFAFGIMGWRLLFGGHPTGLAPNTTVVEFATAYRRALQSGAAWPPRVPGGPWADFLRDCLALRVSARIPHGSELARRCDELPVAITIARPQLPPTQAFESSPTSVASPAAMFEDTVNLAPAGRATPPVQQTTRESALSGPLSAGQPGRGSGPSRAEPAPRRFPWLLLLGSLAGLGAAGAAAYYALFINLPETLPPPLPQSVGSASPSGGPAGLVDGAADAGARVLDLPTTCSAIDGLCACCPSGHDCQGGCDEFVMPGEDFVLRPGLLEGEVTDAGELDAKTEICLRLANNRDVERCSALKSFTDGGVAAAGLTIGGLDLVQTGVEVGVYQRAFSEVPVARTLLKRAVSRSELCKGIELTELDEPGPVRRLVFYLDPPALEAGARCVGEAEARR